jgi:ribonuclease P protein component
MSPDGDMEKEKQDFPKSEKVRKKSEIDRIFRTGARFSCKGMAVRVARNSLPRNRVVFITVRSFEGAVRRNRAKRVAREVWRLNKAALRRGFDVAVILYPGYEDFPVCSALMLGLFRKAGLVE